MNGQSVRLACVLLQTYSLSPQPTDRRNEGPKLKQSGEDHSVRLGATYQQPFTKSFTKLFTSFCPYLTSVVNFTLSRRKNYVCPFTASMTSGPTIRIKEQGLVFLLPRRGNPANIFLLHGSVNFGTCRGSGRWRQC